MSDDVVRGVSGWPRGFSCLLIIMSLYCHQAEGQQPRSTSQPPGVVTAETPRPAADDAPQYIIGPGDTIQVFVWRNPELSVTIPVRPDGKISTPLVEDLVAEGKTPTQLARDIERKLGEYVRAPQVNVIVSTAVGAINQVRVVGQVKTPSAVPYREGMTVLDLVIAVGGLTDFSAGNRAKILRKDDEGNDIQIKVKLDSLMKKGKLSENVQIKPGDVVVVPEAVF